MQLSGFRASARRTNFPRGCETPKRITMLKKAALRNAQAKMINQIWRVAKCCTGERVKSCGNVMRRRALLHVAFRLERLVFRM
jgi:hypothetical protein